MEKFTTGRSEARDMKCHKCLARLPRKANYCQNCGKSVTGNEECIEEALKMKNPDSRNDYEMLSRFAKIQRNEFLKESKQRKHQVSLDPDSLMAREIVYQTALIHQILNEVREGKSNEERGEKSNE